MKSVRGNVPLGVRTIRLVIPSFTHMKRDTQTHFKYTNSCKTSFTPISCMPKWRKMSWMLNAFEITVVWSRYEPQAAILQCSVFQSDPYAHHPSQRLRVKEGGILVRCHWSQGSKVNKCFCIAFSLVKDVGGSYLLHQSLVAVYRTDTEEASNENIILSLNVSIIYKPTYIYSTLKMYILCRITGFIRPSFLPRFCR